MKIILYSSANPDRHGLIGKVIEVDAAKGNRLVCEGLAMVVEHDKPPPAQPAARIVAEHLGHEAIPDDVAVELEDEPEDKDADDGKDEYQEETNEEV